MKLGVPGFILAFCLAHVCTMTGISIFPALLPQFTELWRLSGTEAGAVSSALFLGYTVSVPVLVSLTDRIDARSIYLTSAAVGGLALLGFGLFAEDAVSAGIAYGFYGLALAGTYMPGLRVLGEHLPEELVARATGYYTSSFGLGAGVSYLLAEWIEQTAGWQAVFFVAGGLCGFAAILVMAIAHPVPRSGAPKAWLKLLDPRPVFANRSSMAYSICYALHSYELFAVRSWLVAFLAMSAAFTGSTAEGFTPALVAASMTFLGVAASLFGNELSIRTGRRRAISVAMMLSGLMALAVAWAGFISYWLCAMLAIVHGFLIMMDSSSLTAGAFSSARPHERGITMAVHSTLGFGGAMLGPLVFGLLIDRGGSASQMDVAWAIAYGHIFVVVVAGPLIMRWLNPQPAVGDKR